MNFRIEKQRLREEEEELTETEWVKEWWK